MVVPEAQAMSNSPDDPISTREIQMDPSSVPHHRRRSGSAAAPPLAIVDDPASTHGRRMARALHPDTAVTWIPPTLRLPDELRDTSASVIALPLRVRGGHTHDPFTARLMASVRWLGSRGCLVFVARGPHPNPLADAGIAVTATSGPSCTSASEACVAAAERAWLRECATQECHFHG
jgi:hypothetical protein